MPGAANVPADARHGDHPEAAAEVHLPHEGAVAGHRVVAMGEHAPVFDEGAKADEVLNTTTAVVETGGRLCDLDFD